MLDRLNTQTCPVHRIILINTEKQYFDSFKPAWLLTFTLFNVTAGIRLYLITILDYRIGRRILFVLKEEFMEPLYIVRKGYRYDAASLGTDGSCGTPVMIDIDDVELKHINNYQKTMASDMKREYTPVESTE